MKPAGYILYIMNMKDKKNYFNHLKNMLLENIPLGVDDLTELNMDPNLLVDAGYEYVEEGEFEAALKIFSIGLSIDDSDPDILNGIGISLCELGKLDDSKKVLELAVRHNPDDAVTIANLAGVFWELGDYEKAIHFYTKSIEIDQFMEESYLNLINLYMEAGMLYMAFMECTKFLNENPDHDEGKLIMDDIILNLGISMH